MKILKIRNVKTPERAHSTDAGIDFFMPKFEPEFITDLNTKNVYDDYKEYSNIDVIEIKPHRSILIPSGIKMEIPENTAGIFFNKSGISCKKRLVTGAQVVDNEYEGEVHINLHNISSYSVPLEPDMKLIQLLIVPLMFPEIEEKFKESDIFVNSKSERKEKAFGSTDSKG